MTSVRKWLGPWTAACALLLGTLVGCSGNINEFRDLGATDAPLPDADGDGIADRDEGADDKVDTDEDGTPDYQDTDSDNDGIPDADEAGDDDTNTPPIDSDHDGTADFRDIDSDDNGIPDKDEGSADSDKDGVGDHADADNDGDGILDSDEILGADADCDGDGNADATGTPEEPADCDGDGVPNHMDKDSDGDTIADQQEGTADTDEDSFIDRYDLDSDNDGLTDETEAGDDDIATEAVDTDEDQIPDYRDPDSDNDGIGDADEQTHGTDPLKADTDGDGVTDLIEVAAGTNPTDPGDNPQAHGNFVFVVPYEKPTDPPQDTLEFATSVQFADLYFSFDTTTSMISELAAMGDVNNGVPKIINDLRCEPVQGGKACAIDSDCGAGGVCFDGSCIEDPITANGGDGCIPDMWTGIGKFYNCNTYQNVLHLQPDPVATANAIPGTSTGGAEAPIQAAACVANEAVCSNNNNCSAAAGVANPVGCPGFRPDAVRILLQITDADNQAGAACYSYQISAAGAELVSAGIKFVGLYGTGDDQANNQCTTPKDCAEKLGTAAQTVDQGGNPFVYPALDAQVVTATKQAVMDIVRGVPLNVTITATDEPGDAGDALQFIDYLEVNVSGQGKCTAVTPTADTDSDGHDDSFPQLLGGTPVCWDVNPVPQNTTVEETDEPQLFKAKLTVYGDGSPLDDRSVYFLVPPAPPEIPPPIQ